MSWAKKYAMGILHYCLGVKYGRWKTMSNISQAKDVIEIFHMNIRDIEDPR
jgi:hypothetical protein